MNKLICGTCSRVYHSDQPVWCCECGGLLDLEFQYILDINEITIRRPTMWRYREALPVNNDKNIISFDEGFTPLLVLILSGKKVFIKQDHLFQTGSFNDRGASVLVSKVKELGIKEVIIDSSGNAGCAVAAYCNRAHIKCHVFVPGNTSPKKTAQIRRYGAHLTLVNGTREDTANAAFKAAKKLYYASHYWNPFFVHGIKTLAFEVCEQLRWKAPDTVILPVGNGTLLIGSYIGYTELLKQKIIARVPRLIGIQAASCAPLYNMLKYDLSNTHKLTLKRTIAEGIAIAEPVRARQIIDMILKTNGTILTVTEREIKNAGVEISRSGFYVEPTAAAAIAGTKKYLRTQYRKNELVVSVFTGHGLKV